MEKIIVEKIIIDLKTGEKTRMSATVANVKDDIHKKISLTYEGYISDWHKETYYENQNAS